MDHLSILFLKVPYSPHPKALSKDHNYKTKQPFWPVPSLALAVLCGFIDKYKKLPYEIKAVDLNIEAYTEPNVPIDTSLYPHLLEKTIKENSYDVLALSAMFIFNYRWVEDAVRLSRKYHYKSKIILGGGFATIMPERAIKNHDIVIGEGEVALLHILNKYNNFVDEDFEQKYKSDTYATKYKNKNIDIFNKRSQFINMSDLPMAEWKYLDVEKYFKNSGDYILPIEDSRGCPYQCTYCSTHLFWGRKVRHKPVVQLMDEIKYLKKNYGIKGIRFIGDNMTYSKEWIVAFLKAYLKSNLSIELNVSSFYIDHLDEEIIDLFYAAGVKKIGMGIETGSLEIQKTIKKRVNLDRAKKLIQYLKNKNIYVHLCWMIGFPSETLEQMKATFDLARELNTHGNQFLTVTPYPGTEMYNNLKHNGLLTVDAEDLDTYDNKKSENIKSDMWDYQQIQDMSYDVNIELNFLRNPFLESDYGKKYLIRHFCEILKKLPGHIIAIIMLGYIYEEMGEMDSREYYYQKAATLLKTESLRKTFEKYLSWHYPAIQHYLQYSCTHNH